MHLNAGVSASGAGADDSTFILYRLPLDYPAGANPYTTPNEPPVVTFHEEKTMDITADAELAQRRDAHGVVMSPNRRYLYQFDRTRNNVEVFDMGKVINDPNATLAEQTQAHAATLDLTGSGYCVGEPAPFVNVDGHGYELSDDPARTWWTSRRTAGCSSSPSGGRTRSPSGTRPWGAAPGSASSPWKAMARPVP